MRMGDGTSAGRGSARGTCGEWVQGVLPGGREFHVTCPIDMMSQAKVFVREADGFAVTGAGPGREKAGRALAAVHRLAGEPPVRVLLNVSSELDVGKGMGSSTADVIAAARAAAVAFRVPLSDEQLARIAVGIESSDGSMFPGMVAFGHRDGVVLHRFAWAPRCAIVMLVPPEGVDTALADRSGVGRYAREFESILSDLMAAERERDAHRFARAATRSALLNQEFLPNRCFQLLCEHADRLGAAGVVAAHTGTAAGLLYPGAPGAGEAERAAAALRGIVPPGVRVVVTAGGGLG